MRSLAHVVAFGLGVIAASCGRLAEEPPHDFTEEVEQICADYCEMNVACREPPWFDSYAECESVCLGYELLYHDTDCGAAERAKMTCIGMQPTCELFNDSNNVDADDYTCKAEKEHFLSLRCGEADT